MSTVDDMRALAKRIYKFEPGLLEFMPMTIVRMYREINEKILNGDEERVNIDIPGVPPIFVMKDEIGADKMKRILEIDFHIKGDFSRAYIDGILRRTYLTPDENGKPRIRLVREVLEEMDAKYTSTQTEEQQPFRDLPPTTQK